MIKISIKNALTGVKRKISLFFFNFWPNLSKVKFGGIKYLNWALQNRHAFLRTPRQFICALTVSTNLKFSSLISPLLFFGNFNCRNNSLGEKGNQLISSKIQRNNNENLARRQFLKINDYKSFKDFKWDIFFWKRQTYFDQKIHDFNSFFQNNTIFFIDNPSE